MVKYFFSLLLLAITLRGNGQPSLPGNPTLPSSQQEWGREVPYLVKYNEGHGWTQEENIIELMDLILGFMAKHLKDSPVND